MEKYGKLIQCQQISQQMFELAKKGEWDSLTELEQQRQELMHAFFERPGFTANDSQYIEQVIKDVLAINEQLVQLAEQEKTTIGQQLHGMKKRQTVHSAYIQNK